MRFHSGQVDKHSCYHVSDHEKQLFFHLGKRYKDHYLIQFYISLPDTDYNEILQKDTSLLDTYSHCAWLTLQN